MVEEGYQKYRYYLGGQKEKARHPGFKDDVRKLAECYVKTMCNMTDAMRLFKEIYPENLRRSGYVTALANDLVEQLAIDGDYREKLKDIAIYYDVCLKIEEDKMFETGETEGVLNVLSESQKALNIRKGSQVTVNSPTTVNNNTVNIDYKTRISDLPIEIQEALKKVASFKKETKAIDAVKQVIEIGGTPGETSNKGLLSQMFEEKELAPSESNDKEFGKDL